MCVFWGVLGEGLRILGGGSLCRLRLFRTWSGCLLLLGRLGGLGAALGSRLLGEGRDRHLLEDHRAGDEELDRQPRVRLHSSHGIEPP